jgi:DNA-directed RNA polymerase beta subunit
VGDIIVPFLKSDEVIDTDYYKIFDHHGRFFGWCKNMQQLNKIFLNARRKMDFDPFVSRHQDDLLQEWRIYCDIGRLVRPLLVMKNLHKIPKLIEDCASGTSIIPTLLTNGCIEYVSPSEEDSCRVTFTLPKTLEEFEKHTHLEVNDVSFVGIIAALSPFFRHNQGPRLVYWIGMSKQAIGTSTKQDNGSATTHNLWYGQKPMVVTKTSRDLNMDQIPDCVNVTIILFPHSANQEDAIVMNRASVERGMFISDSVRTYDAEKVASCNETSSEKFERPVSGQIFSMKDADYSKLQENGIPKIGQAVNGGDVIIGKTIPIKKISQSAVVNVPSRIRSSEYQLKRRDKSIQVRDDEKGIVSSVLLAHKPQCEIAKVRVRTTRIPERGDKFSSRVRSQLCLGMISHFVFSCSMPRRDASVCLRIRNRCHSLCKLG